ncbi:hypothetical protein PNOK_0653800 [Pyrrhoderma noxium]|uniref:Uncharacterized protein n=1 Tax=Pyrrhoderma noxium TaxID=2282107 RepID=A0A286UEK2_9AGAM|nr:hypothetical protein PNOK_0653800 [Pyrrhoderma noxium]
MVNLTRYHRNIDTDQILRSILLVPKVKQKHIKSLKLRLMYRPKIRSSFVFISRQLSTLNPSASLYNNHFCTTPLILSQHYQPTTPSSPGLRALQLGSGNTANIPHVKQKKYVSQLDPSIGYARHLTASHPTMSVPVSSNDIFYESSQISCDCADQSEDIKPRNTYNVDCFASDSPAMGHGDESQNPNQLQSSTCSIYAPGPSSGSTLNGGSITPSPSLSSEGHQSSDTQILSSSRSPTPSFSDLPEERPQQRRRITLRDSQRCIGHDVNETSDAPLTLRQKRTKKSSQARTKDNKVEKGKGRNSTRTYPNGSASFSTFVVDPTPLSYEPSGATYMSTMDFEATSDSQVFEHGPTDLPPRPYIGGPDAASPWKPRKNLGTIPGSALDYLPVVEDRMARLEKALHAYVRFRGEQALRNATLPGLSCDENDSSDNQWTLTAFDWLSMNSL